MDNLKRLATDRPIWFAVVVTLLLVMIYFAAGIAAAIVADDDPGLELLNGLGRLLGSLFLLYLLWRLGWLRAAWIASPGSWQAWLLALVLTAYQVTVALYSFWEELSLGFSWSALTQGVVANHLAVGLLEEAVARADRDT